MLPPLLAVADNLRSILAWSAIFFVLLVIGFIVVAAVRKRLRPEDPTPMSGGLGFSLHELRQMHRTGELTDEQYAKLRDRLVGKLAGPAEGEDQEAPPDEGDRRGASDDPPPPGGKTGGGGG